MIFDYFNIVTIIILKINVRSERYILLTCRAESGRDLLNILHFSSKILVKHIIDCICTIDTDVFKYIAFTFISPDLTLLRHLVLDLQDL